MRNLALAGGGFFLLGLPTAAFAGMPSITYTDAARMRLQTLSFFLVVFFLSAAVIQRLWNYLGRDFTFLPRLSYGKAVGLVGLWGLLFILVLTMISGARELMTPGAWEKQGFTYRLADNAAHAAQPPTLSLDQRRAGLETLRASLWEYARTHEGRFPPERFGPWLPDSRWRLPGNSGMNYVYVGGLRADQGAAPLAFEPDIFGGPRLVLLTSGEVRSLRDNEFTRAEATRLP